MKIKQSISIIIHGKDIQYIGHAGPPKKQHVLVDGALHNRNTVSQLKYNNKLRLTSYNTKTGIFCYSRLNTLHTFTHQQSHNTIAIQREGKNILTSILPFKMLPCHGTLSCTPGSWLYNVATYFLLLIHLFLNKYE